MPAIALTALAACAAPTRALRVTNTAAATVAVECAIHDDQRGCSGSSQLSAQESLVVRTDIADAPEATVGVRWRAHDQTMHFRLVGFAAAQAEVSLRLTPDHTIEVVDDAAAGIRLQRLADR